MSVYEMVRRRRSIRKYEDRMVADAEVTQILEAGRWAPSGLNNQPWRFMVVTDRETKDGLARFTKYGRIIKAAPLLIVVCMDQKASYNRDKDLMAIGAFIQNMLLAACELNVGTCWLGEILNRKEEVAAYLGLPDNLELMAVVTVGYLAETGGKGKRRSLEALAITDRRSARGSRIKFERTRVREKREDDENS